MSPEEVAQILDELERRLGPSAETAFRLAMKQVAIDATWSVIAAIVFGLATLAASTFVVYAMARNRRADRYSDWPLAAFVGVMFAAVLAALTGTAAIHATSLLLNPEWAALAKLLGGIR